MNERLVQIDKGIKLLQEERERLLKPKAKHGDIISYGKLNRVLMSVDGTLMGFDEYGCTQHGEVQGLVDRGTYRIIGNIFNGDKL